MVPWANKSSKPIYSHSLDYAWRYTEPNRCEDRQRLSHGYWMFEVHQSSAIQLKSNRKEKITSFWQSVIFKVKHEGASRKEKEAQD